MPKLLLLLAVISLASCLGQSAVAEEPIDLCDFDLVFADEFNDLSISPYLLEGKRWTAHTPWSGDFGDAAFTDPGPSGPFSIEDGKLKISAWRDQNGKWRSGLIAAADYTGEGHGVQFGYFETRMRMPPGPGTWPAFWLSTLKPTASKVPSVEIDVIEYYGHATQTYQTAYHVWYPEDRKDMNRGDLETISIPDQSAVKGFNTYGVRVAPDKITYYFNRKAIWAIKTPPELQRPLFPMVNLALGSGFPIDKTADPSVLWVDYVRIYRAKPGDLVGSCDVGQPAHAKVR